MDNTFSLPQDLAGCQRLIEEQARAILDLQRSREQLQQSNETLQLTLDKLLRQIYGDRTRTPLPAKVVMELVRSLFGVIGVAGFMTSLLTDCYC